MARTLLGTGYHAADTREQQLAITANTYLGDAARMGVLFHHGASSPYGTALKAIDRTSQPSTAKLLYQIANTGWPVLSCDFGYQDDLYGNDANIDRITSGKAWLQASLPTGVGAKAGKVALFGGSMGGGAMMAWARANLNSVACMILLIPMCDINDIVVNNRMNVASEINAVYPGGAYDDNRDGPTHSPVRFASQLAGIPTQIWYATDDDVCIPSTVQTVISAIGSSCEAHTLTGGHSDAAISQVNAVTMLEFLRLHAL